MQSSFLSQEVLSSLQQTINAVLEEEKRRAAEESKQTQQQSDRIEISRIFEPLVAPPGPNTVQAIDAWWKLLRKADGVSRDNFVYFSRKVLLVLDSVCPAGSDSEHKASEATLGALWDQRLGSHVKYCGKHDFEDLQRKVLRIGFGKANPEEFIDDKQLQVMTRHLVERARRDQVELAGLYNQDVQRLLRKGIVRAEASTTQMAREAFIRLHNKHARSSTENAEKLTQPISRKVGPPEANPRFNLERLENKGDAAISVNAWLDYVAFPEAKVSHFVKKEQKKSDPKPKSEKVVLTATETVGATGDRPLERTSSTFGEENLQPRRNPSTLGQKKSMRLPSFYETVSPFASERKMAKGYQLLIERLLVESKFLLSEMRVRSRVEKEWISLVDVWHRQLLPKLHDLLVREADSSPDSKRRFTGNFTQSDMQNPKRIGGSLFLSDTVNVCEPDEQPDDDTLKSPTVLTLKSFEPTAHREDKESESSQSFEEDLAPPHAETLESTVRSTDFPTYAPGRIILSSEFRRAVMPKPRRGSSSTQEPPPMKSFHRPWPYSFRVSVAEALRFTAAKSNSLFTVK